MSAIEASLDVLNSQHPEWQPWLVVVQTILAESADPKWDALVPPRPEAAGKVPLLSEATIALDKNLARSLLTKLAGVACRSGTPKMATLRGVAEAQPDILAVFKASLEQNHNQLKTIAAALGADAEAFQAVAAILSVPFLQACNRRWARALPAGWTEGYCPICGAWPALAEVRGIERSRYLRCGRCGSEWPAHCLFCPYCGMTDHKELASLVPEKSFSNSVIDACNRCLGYVKTLTKLQGSSPAEIMLDDLASVELDVAAAEQGYKRPQGLGYLLNATLIENGGAKYSFA